MMNSFSVFLSRNLFFLFIMFVRSLTTHKICSAEEIFKVERNENILCIYKRPLTEDDERNGLVWRSHYKTDRNRTLMN